MSELGDIVNAVRGLLAGLQSGGEDLFATVEVHQVSERKAALAALGRERKPAAFILYDGRARSDVEEGAGGAATLSVLTAAENLRGGSAALLGGFDGLGQLDLLERVTAALDGAVLETNYNLAAVDERPLATDERSIVFESRFRIQRLAEIAAPTFSGIPIAGGDSAVSVLIGPIAVNAVAFGFPGIDGEYRHLTTVKGRTLSWVGQLRAADDAALGVIEADLERRLALGGVATMIDAWGRAFPECVLQSFERKGPRRRHAITGRVVQGFELRFTQLRS